MFLRVAPEAGERTLRWMFWTSGTGFPMEREKKLVLEWEGEGTVRDTGNAPVPSLAGEVAAEGGSQLLQPGRQGNAGSGQFTGLRPPS